jgi:hypothetical protein
MPPGGQTGRQHPAVRARIEDPFQHLQPFQFTSLFTGMKHVVCLDHLLSFT